MARLSQIDLLIEAGLAPIKKLAYARIVMSDVSTGIKNMVYRELAIRMWGKIGNYILTDSILYNRLRVLLQQSHPMTEAAFENLIEKAEKYGIPFDVVMEVYERGYAEKPPEHLTPDQNAFNRVNSFVAGGKARDLDADLVNEWKPAQQMQWGSDSLAKEYMKDTPGQSKTLNTLRKVLKK